MKTTPRSLIRQYLELLIKTKVAVGDRVFINRDLETSPLTYIDLPCVLIVFNDDSFNPIVGSGNKVDEYENTLDIFIIPVVSISDSENAQDTIDNLEHDIIRALYDDYKFSKLLANYDSSKEFNDGLTMGHCIKSVTPYVMTSKIEIATIANSININIKYNLQSWSNEKLVDFLSFGIDIKNGG